MDAHALLTSQGWRGSGHSLHPTSDNNGLLRPLLVSKKQNNLGVGKKQHSTSDMWWMNAFDKSLKGLDTTKEGKVVQTLTTGALDMVVNGGSKFVGNRGLYASFVRGESLSGTITPEESVEARAGQKRRAEDKGEGKERRKANKATARTARAHSLVVSEPLAPTTSSEPAEIDGGEEDATVTAPKTKAELRERRKRKKLMCKAKEQSTEEVMSTAKRRKRRKS